MKSKPQIFISSTSDLADERQALAKSLSSDYEPYLFEEDRARAASPEQHCAAMIKDSEVFLGVVGENYGSSYSAADQRSICEWEFDTARQQPELAMMMLLHEPADEAAIDPEQKAFRERITGFSSGVWCRFFRTSQELVSLAQQSLTRWLVERLVQAKEQAQHRSSWLRRRTVPIAAGTVIALGAIIAADLAVNLMSPQYLLALCALAACVLLMLLVINIAESGGLRK